VTTAVRRRLAPAARRAQLLDAAEAVFAEHGYQGTAMEDIAVAAGVARGLIYNYFRDKDELYLACVQRARVELEAAFTSAVAGHAEPRAQLEGAVRAYFSFVATRGRSWEILFGGGAAVAGGVAAEVARLRFDTVAAIAALLRAAVPGLDAAVATPYAHVLSGAGEQLAKWWRTQPDVPLDQVVALQMDVVWDGLAATAGRLVEERR
jgi:AcrR family transcriptional regulator